MSLLSSKKLLGVLFSSAIICGICRPVMAFEQSPFDVPFAGLSVSKLMVMPDAVGHEDWVSAIGMAQRSIHLAMYHLTDRVVINALLQKAQTSHVDLRVIVDGASLKGGYQKAIQSLVNAGVQVRASSPAFSIMHEKAIVIDGQMAFITSINLTNTAQTSRDYGVITQDPGVIEEMERVFEADWLNSQNGTAVTPVLTNPYLAWSPNNSKSRLLSLINSARVTIAANVETLTDQDVMIAFATARARGVRVLLITPMCLFGQALLNYPGLKYLKAAGVEVHVMPNSGTAEQPYMHAKMMVVDSELVYVGSINYSYNSIERARELGIIFVNPAVGQAMLQYFNLDWAHSVIPQDDPPASICPQQSMHGSSVSSSISSSVSLLGMQEAS